MLLFTPEVFFSMVARYNAAIWPAQLLGLTLGLLAIALTLRAGRWNDRIVAAILALSWIWTGLVFHGIHFAGINWAAWGFAALFGLQGLLLAWAGVLRGRLRFRFRFRFRPDAAGWLGLACVLAALALHPLLGLGLGRELAALRPVPLAPAPLVLFTAGLLALAGARWLFAVPILWALGAGLAAWFLPVPEDLILPPAVLACLVAALVGRSRPGQSPG